ncbi:MAG: LysR family transcriptional regulator [Burkholderiales bacterium]|jgi:DNA-binding transcriptional LysR family regulator|nr:LysR family transcriptional regulator [Burkholderiales bacterium]
MDFDLRQLRHARALAEEGSFARAARALHLTQPALSRSIQMLERRVGVLLFDRGKSRVVPTDMGRLFLAHAQEVLDGAAALDREVALMRGAASGSLVLGAGTVVSAISVERALASFVARHPGVALRVVNDSGTDLLGLLRIGEIDLFAGSMPVGADRDGLTIVPLRTRTGCFYVRPGHPLAASGPIPVDEALRAPMVGPTRLPPVLVDRILRARGGEDAGAIFAFACESVSMMRAVARETDLVLVATPEMVATDLDAGHLVPLRVEGASPTQEFGVVRLSGRSLPAVADALVEAIVAADAANDGIDEVAAGRLEATATR